MNDPRLLAVAARFIRDIGHHRDVRSEELAEAFRDATGLGPFPRYTELCEAAGRLDIRIEFLPATSPFEGSNTWGTDDGPVLYVRRGLTDAREETTLCHELRELLENAFKRVKPSYEAMDTHDNDRMNPRSDAFAGALLMQAGPTHELLANLGFDLAAVSRVSARSLPAVFMRVRTVLSASSAFDGPVAGFWLYEAGWDIVKSGTSEAEDLRVRHLTQTKGFSLSDKNASIPFLPARLPSQGSGADEFPMAAAALSTGAPTCARVGPPTLFDPSPYVAVAEPLFAYDGSPRRVVLSVVRRDGLVMMRPWLERLQVENALAEARSLAEWQRDCQ